MKQTDAGVLNVGYPENGPADGFAAILLHSWLNDIHSFVYWEMSATSRKSLTRSELQRDIFGKDKNLCRLVYVVASLPLGTPVELEVVFEVAA